MKKIVNILVFILIIHILSAQHNYKPAIIIGLQNDTLKGFVDYRTDQLNSSECRFRTAENTPDRLFKPEQIAGYKLPKDGKYYISHEIAIDSVNRRTLFLEFLVQGTVNLYYYQDQENFDHYYFEKTKGELIEVTKEREKISNLRFKVEKTWYSSASNYNKNMNDRNYRIVLANIFNESLRISARANNAGFERKDFIDLTSQYNAEMDKNNPTNIVFANDNFKTFFETTITLSGGAQYIKYVSLPIYLIQNYSIESQSIMPVVAAQLTLTSPRVSKSFAIIADLSMSQFTGACDYVGKYNSYYNYQYNALRVGTSIGVKYIYTKTNFCPFIEAALANSFFMFKSSRLDIYDSYFDHIVKTNYLLPENLIGGYRLALGCNYLLKNNHSVVAKINYEKQNDYKDQITVWELKLGYSF